MRDKDGDEIKGLAHVERGVRVDSKGETQHRDLSIAFIEMPPQHVDLCRVLVGPSQATARKEDLITVLTLEQAQRIGVAIIRAATRARGGGVEVGSGRLMSDVELAAQEMELLESKVTQLQDNCTQAYQERDAAHAELDAARLDAASLRIDFRSIAEAAGRVESIEGQGEHVGSVEEVITSIEEGERAKHDVAEWQAWADETAALQLDQTDPDAVLPDDDRRVLIRESCQEMVVVRGALTEVTAAAAVMREAGERALAADLGSDEEHIAMADLRGAIESGDAGRALLAELAALREVAKAVRGFRITYVKHDEGGLLIEMTGEKETRDALAKLDALKVPA